MGNNQSMDLPTAGRSRTAFLYDKMEDKRVHCVCCNQKCTISPNQTGECGVRMNKEGELQLIVYGTLCSVHDDPMEKKPLHHFLCGTSITSVGTVGCNFSCSFCQNHDISQQSKEVRDMLRRKGQLETMDIEVSKFGYKLSPEDLIQYTKKRGIGAIAFTYNEPTIQTEFAYDVAKLAHKHNIKIVYVSNGYESDECLDVMGPYIDAINIDLKAFRNSFYQTLSRVRLAPVLRTIRRCFEMGIHVEVTTLVIPGENDSSEELQDIANFICSVSPDIPWHISAFHPDYRMLDKHRTPVATLSRARRIGQKAGLHYIFMGNVASEEGLNTNCPNPKCEELLIQRKLGRRVTYKSSFDRINGRCGKCGTKIYGVFDSSVPSRGSFVKEDLETKFGFPRTIDASARRSPKEGAPITGANPVRILYATQTGTAEEFARQLGEECNACGMTCAVMNIEKYDEDLLLNEKLVIMVVSTHGEGDPPDSARHFMHWIMNINKDKSESMLSKVKYSVFGLGRKAYGEHYCQFARTLQSRFDELGAKSLTPIAYGDDTSPGVQESQWMEWKTNTLSALFKLYGIAGGDIDAQMRMKMKIEPRYRLSQHSIDADVDVDGAALQKQRKKNVNEIGRSPKTPFSGTVIENKLLTEAGFEKVTKRITIDVSGAPSMLFEAGDHLGVFPVNDKRTVLALCHRLDESDPNMVFTLDPQSQSYGDSSGSSSGLDSVPLHSRFSTPMSLFDALSHHCDITSPPRRSLLRMLSVYAEDKNEGAQLADLSIGRSVEAQKMYQSFIDERISLMELLKMFPSVHPPLEHLLDSLPVLAPRFYSISSSPKVQPDSISLTVAVVEFSTPKGKHVKGLCSTYLSGLGVGGGSGSRVQCFVRESSFRLPVDVDTAQTTTPILMVGGGCGIAPYIGFIQELGAGKSETHKSESVLVFGCRDRVNDRLYGSLIDQAVEEGTVSEAWMAFSREQSEKVYVQHRLLEHGAAVWKMLATDKGCLYVCGNGETLGKDVEGAIIEIAMLHGGMKKEEALLWITQQKECGLYKEDLLSVSYS